MRSSFRNSVLTKITRQQHSKWIWYVSVLIFLSLSVVVFSLQQIDFQQTAKQGLIVPDSVNMTFSLNNNWISGKIFSAESDLLLIDILYGWTWLLHPIICYPINLILIIISLWKFKKLAIEQLGAPSWSVLGVVLNPYLILAMPGPNKEIPLLFLTIWLCNLLVNRNRRWFIGSTILCILIYLLRDGYGVFLFLCACVLWLLGRYERLFPMVMCTILIGVASLFGIFSSIIPTLSRNVAIYKSTFATQVATGAIAASLKLDPLSFFGGIILFGFRLLYNLLSLAMFPILSTSEGQIYWIGLSYWISGLIILSTTSIAFFTLCRGSNALRTPYLLSGLVLSTWFMVSVSLFVQPRYLMPVFPIAFIILSTAPKKLRNLCISGTLAFSLSILLINTVLNGPQSSTYLDEFATPAYIW